MQPLAAGRSRFFCCDRDELRPDAAPTGPLRNDGIQDERVHASVPRHVDEADERAARPRANPPKAVLLDLTDPLVVEHAMLECLGVERVQLVVGERPAPFVCDFHQWGREDSNLRRLSRRVYSPFPLAARAHPRGAAL